MSLLQNNLNAKDLEIKLKKLNIVILLFSIFSIIIIPFHWTGYFFILGILFSIYKKKKCRKKIASLKKMSKSNKHVEEGKQYTALGPTELLKEFLESKTFDLCIEIGSFEGQTSNCIARHLSKEGKLICIDPLEDTYITESIDEVADEHNKGRWKYFQGQYERFIHNTREYISSGKIELIRKISTDAFKDLEHLKGKVDFCFIDGDHRTQAVLLDGINCLHLCKIGGYLLFDDYGWGKNIDEDFDCGKGVDIFIEKHKGQIEVLQKTSQVLIKKIG